MSALCQKRTLQQKRPLPDYDAPLRSDKKPAKLSAGGGSLMDSDLIVGVIMLVAIVAIVAVVWRERYTRFFDEP
jgi:hypothetical protein